MIRGARLPASAEAVLLVCVLAAGCSTTPTATSYDGLKCDDSFHCLSGYACKRTSNTCVPVSECPAVGGDGSCQLCGDTFKTGSEECDAGSESATCNSDCTTVRCGDQKRNVTAGEQCDEGTDRNDGRYGGCTNDCRWSPTCGDGVLQLDHEQCDPGVTGMEGCDATACQAHDGYLCGLKPGVTGGPGAPDNDCDRCGDGTHGPHETCDSGAAANADGYAPAAHCNSTCTGWAPSCGDGTPDSLEQCDAGGKCTNGSLCVFGGGPCGDGSTCVSQNVGAYNGCTAQCTLGPRCGDGVIDASEGCDFGTRTDLAGCTGACTVVASYTCRVEFQSGAPDSPNNRCYQCGNGVLDPTEQCDAGSTSMLGCDSACHAGPGYACQKNGSAGTPAAPDNVCAKCGDGDPVPGLEACDQGAANSDTWSKDKHCNKTCTGWAPYCGDGLLQSSFEACDGGSKGITGCTSCAADTGYSCIKITSPSPGVNNPDSDCFQCGDGILNGTEQCDLGGANGGTSGCALTCTPQATFSCGCKAGETCSATAKTHDPYGAGNPDNDCDECGDAVAGTQETCDDGDTNNCTPPCNDTCQKVSNVCGDGRADCGEQCDQGDLKGQNCGSIGYAGGGPLGCAANCRYDVSGCLGCSNLDGDTLCDDIDPTPGGAKACSSHGGVLVLAQDTDGAAAGVQLGAPDSALVGLLEAWGYGDAWGYSGKVVELASCPLATVGSGTEAGKLLRAAATSRLVVVSNSCAPADVSQNVLRWLRQGVIVLQPGLWGALGVTAGSPAKPASTGPVQIPTNGHFVTKFAGTEKLVQASGLVATDAAEAGATVLASVGGLATVAVEDVGASLSGGGTAAGRRAVFGVGNGEVRQLTATGRALLHRLVLWTSGRDDAATCMYCGQESADQDSDGYGDTCDCDVLVPTCQLQAADVGASDANPARDCTRNWDVAGGAHAYESASSFYTAPDCYEVFCRSDWNKGRNGDALAGTDGTDCHKSDGTDISASLGSSTLTNLLITNPNAAAAARPQVSYDSNTTVPTTLAWWTSVVPINFGSSGNPGRRSLTILSPSVLDLYSITASALTVSGTLRNTSVVTSGNVTVGNNGTFDRNIVTSTAGNISVAGSTASVTNSALTTADITKTITVSGTDSALDRVTILSQHNPAFEVNTLSTNSNVSLSRLDVGGCGTDGAAVQLTSSPARIEHSRITCGLYGVRIGATTNGNAVRDNLLVGQTGSGVSLLDGANGVFIDNNTISGIPGGTRPARGIGINGGAADLCIRNNIFSHLGDLTTTGHAIDMGPAASLTYTGAFASNCVSWLAPGNTVSCTGPDCKLAATTPTSNVIWRNSLFDALGTCVSVAAQQCERLPCLDYTAQSLCASLPIRHARFFTFADVANSPVNTSTDPGFVDPANGNWCVRSPELIDGAMNLDRGRVPAFQGGESHMGSAPDVGALEAGTGICTGAP